jgi:hypothetical protein
MRRLAVVALALCALLVAGCGSTTPLNFKGKSRPSPPVDVSVYLNQRQILASPGSVAAGLVAFTFANQSSNTQYILIRHHGYHSVISRDHQSLPIRAGATAQLTLDIGPGDYEIGTAAEFLGAALDDHYVTPAPLRVGPPGQAGDSALLQP